MRADIGKTIPPRDPNDDLRLGARAALRQLTERGRVRLFDFVLRDLRVPSRAAEYVDKPGRRVGVSRAA